MLHPTPTLILITVISGPDNSVFLIIDMQTDFCGKGGYVDKMGYDISLTRALIAHILKVLVESPNHRHARVPHPERAIGRTLADLPEISAGAAGVSEPVSETRSVRKILVRGEPGWDIIPELAPKPGEPSSINPGKARSGRPIWRCCCGFAASKM